VATGLDRGLGHRRPRHLGGTARTVAVLECSTPSQYSAPFVKVGTPLVPSRYCVLVVAVSEPESHRSVVGQPSASDA
jgi:hypothetical protein